MTHVSDDAVRQQSHTRRRTAWPTARVRYLLEVGRRQSCSAERPMRGIGAVDAHVRHHGRASGGVLEVRGGGTRGSDTRTCSTTPPLNRPSRRRRRRAACRRRRHSHDRAALASDGHLEVVTSRRRPPRRLRSVPPAIEPVAGVSCRSCGSVAAGAGGGRRAAALLSTACGRASSGSRHVSSTSASAACTATGHAGVKLVPRSLRAPRTSPPTPTKFSDG